MISTKTHALTVLLMLAIIILFVYFHEQEKRKTERLTLALDIWQNCPLPPKGTLLVIESDWPEQKPDEQMRCGFVKKPRGMKPTAGLLTSELQYDRRCLRGLCR